jgi:trehalose-6-phosphatase
MFIVKGRSARMKIRMTTRRRFRITTIPPTRMRLSTIGGDDTDDELDVFRHLRTSAVKPNAKEENKTEPKKQIKEVKAERKSLKRAAEEEGKEPSAFAG